MTSNYRGAILCLLQEEIDSTSSWIFVKIVDV